LGSLTLAISGGERRGRGGGGEGKGGEGREGAVPHHFLKRCDAPVSHQLMVVWFRAIIQGILCGIMRFTSSTRIYLTY
jgi:hypothetical protein